MKPDLLKNYYTIFRDCWNLFKKYSDPRDNEEYWKALSVDVNELYNKHGKVMFSQKLISLVIEEMETEWKKKDEKLKRLEEE